MNNNIVEFLNSKNKVELSSQVIELALATDIANELKFANKEADSVAKFIASAVKPIDNAIFNNKSARIAASNVLVMIGDLEKQVKDLGLTVPANIEGIKADATKLLSQAQSLESKLPKISADLK